MADWTFDKNGVIATIKGPVVTVRIDRPDLKNGMDKDSFFAMEEALKHISQDADAQVIVYTGTGDYFYSRGQPDLRDRPGEILCCQGFDQASVHRGSEWSLSEGRNELAVRLRYGSCQILEHLWISGSPDGRCPDAGYV